MWRWHLQQIYFMIDERWRVVQKLKFIFSQVSPCELKLYKIMGCKWKQFYNILKKVKNNIQCNNAIPKCYNYLFIQVNLFKMKMFSSTSESWAHIVVHYHLEKVIFTTWPHLYCRWRTVSLQIYVFITLAAHYTLVTVILQSYNHLCRPVLHLVGPQPFSLYWCWQKIPHFLKFF